MFAVLYNTGARVSEVARLKLEELDLDRGGTVLLTGKGRKQRIVPLLPTVVAAIDDYLAACPHPLPGEGPLFVGQSDIVTDVFDVIATAAQTEDNILVTGESGTGKELVARAIHQASLRSDKTFLNVDMGAISESLFESELFGHKKGAFTDAKSDRIGRFELANGGTIILDEIAELEPGMQVKLLRLLENRTFRRLGGVLQRFA